MAIEITPSSVRFTDQDKADMDFIMQKFWPFFPSRTAVTRFALQFLVGIVSMDHTLLNRLQTMQEALSSAVVAQLHFGFPRAK